MLVRIREVDSARLPRSRSPLQGSVLTLVIALWVAGCGESGCGRLDEGAEDYEEAWGVSPPASVEVARSQYKHSWGSGHQVFFFELDGNRDFAGSLVQELGLVKIRSDPSLNLQFCIDRPEWFAPGAISNYIVYQVVKPKEAHTLLLNRRNEAHYLYGCRRLIAPRRRR